jgi:hypothetical protein
MPILPDRMKKYFRLCVAPKGKALGYVFIPKCGSTSIKTAFGQMRGSRYHHYDLHTAATKKAVDGREMFTVLRDPMTRVVSAYMEANNERPELKGRPEHEKLWKLKDLPQKGFLHFLDTIERVWFDPHALPQSFFVNLPGVAIKRWFAFEEMDWVLRGYLAEHGVTLPAKHYQRTRKHKHKMIVKRMLLASRELQARVRRLYANDYALRRDKIGAK